MRILVLLSTNGKWGTRTEYTKLRKHLVADGFFEIAPESYVRIVPNRREVEAHVRRLKGHAPKTGVVRAFAFTEKQWKRGVFISGESDYQDRIVGANRHVTL